MHKIIKEDLDIICSSDLDWGKLANSTVLITGAYGMLGQYMVHTLMHLNELNPTMNIKVIALCRDYSKTEEIFKIYDNNILFCIMWDDVAGKLLGLPKLDYIIHAASPANAQNYNSNPLSVIDANVFGTRNLLDISITNNVKDF